MSKKQESESRFNDVSDLVEIVQGEDAEPRLDPETGEPRPQVSEASAELTAELSNRAAAAVNGAQTEEHLLSRCVGGTPVYRDGQ
jgi:hypothetical protein